MDPQVQASFIPKKSLSTRPVGGGGFGLLYLIAIFLFVVSLVAAGAAFAYTQYLKSALASKAHSLELAQGAYEPGAIQDLIRLDQRMVNARSLLQKHTALSGIFDLLSEETLAQVQFLNFTTNPQDGGNYHIHLTGTADTFSTLALQSDQFGANKSLSDVVFSNIAVSQTGTVTFDVEAVVDAATISYAKHLSPDTVTPTTNPTGTSTPATSGTSTTTAPKGKIETPTPIPGGGPGGLPPL
ncbi:hypothetical protein KW798_01095 [Candidatus Parcubacteria bacterium]|nr:hypothetical protein [Candidatus Parcubacteria bacterium]